MGESEISERAKRGIFSTDLRRRPGYSLVSWLRFEECLRREEGMIIRRIWECARRGFHKFFSSNSWILITDDVPKEALIALERLVRKSRCS